MVLSWSGFMNGSKLRQLSTEYLRDNFEPKDRLAVVLIHKRAKTVIQRLTTAERLRSDEVQDWLRDHNSRRFEVYVSMNALRPEATGRKKADIDAIRHVYLDLDEDGTARLEALLAREDLPKPNYIVNSSPNKWQVIWKVQEFSKDQAEGLQRGLARDCGADPAATDCARVLRLPGFYNYKY